MFATLIENQVFTFGRKLPAFNSYHNSADHYQHPVVSLTWKLRPYLPGPHPLYSLVVTSVLMLPLFMVTVLMLQLSISRGCMHDSGAPAAASAAHRQMQRGRACAAARRYMRSSRAISAAVLLLV